MCPATRGEDQNQASPRPLVLLRLTYDVCLPCQGATAPVAFKKQTYHETVVASMSMEDLTTTWARSVHTRTKHQDTTFGAKPNKKVEQPVEGFVQLVCHSQDKRSRQVARLFLGSLGVFPKTLGFFLSYNTILAQSNGEATRNKGNQRSGHFIR